MKEQKNDRVEEADSASASQYLTFKLGDEVFALDVAQVREVLDLIPITKVPGTPDFMRGVINVRGSVVPVMDLRFKFGLSDIKETLDTRIIVMEITLEDEITVLGTLADSVDEVLDIEADQIEPPPRIGMRWKTEFIRGIGKRDDQFIIILDIDRVFSTDELMLAESVEAVPETDTDEGAAE
ncbi:chemotaxis protein CheW [Desulfonema ishimotonii]|uniref:Chemotaxis protein CheW n=1 Tax=Desulfonema ishimotonii TaxID=45657 RepID=A0A401FVB8_9BACT|nr:chemotaxis protein CheW [Desulfonema ishimotonii]GBC60898.1 chemotaxis protein CheW [Desulfonema ishimotonii]